MQANSWVVLGSLIVGLMAPAHAGKRKTVYAVDETALHARPHDTAPSLSRAARGAALKVVGSRGRWLRVRLGKRVGWVARSRVDARAPVKREAGSGFAGKPVSDAVKVVIEIDRVRGFDDPRTKAKNVLDLTRGDLVTVLGRGHEGWILVSAAAGSVGWIPESAVSDAGKFVADPRAEVPTIELPAMDVSKPDVAQPSRFAGTLLATVGAQTFAMREGETLSIASGQAGSVGAGARIRIARDGWVGLAGNLDLGTADLVYYSTTEPSQPIPTRQVVVDAYAEVGWGQRFYVAARGGYHHASLSVDSDRTEPMLLGEQTAGLTAGLGGGMGITSRVSLAVSVDVMPSGTQHWESVPGTPETTTVRGAWGRTQLAVRLISHVVAAVSYRATVVGSATRTDQAHAVTAGVGVTW